MKLKYLGTAAAEGWPAVFCSCTSCERARRLGGKNIRTRSQAIVDGRLLIDFPPDSMTHDHAHDIGLRNITDILITHSHTDHFYPADLLERHPPFSAEPMPHLRLYGNAAVGQRLQQDPEYAESGRYMSFTRLAPLDTVQTGPYTVTALRALHDRSEECLIYHITDGKKALLYGNDTGFFPDDTWAFLQGKRLDLVSLDCTMQLGRDGGNHMGLPDNAEVKQRMMREGMADESTVFVVNHFSHGAGSGVDHDTMAAAAAAEGFLTSWDGFEVEV